MYIKLRCGINKTIYIYNSFIFSIRLSTLDNANKANIDLAKGKNQIRNRFGY